MFDTGYILAEKEIWLKNLRLLGIYVHAYRVHKILDICNI